MPPRTEQLDAIVIGTGQGGTPLARAFARAGLKTAIIERDARGGGTRVVEGCTPTRTMIASARIAHLARRAADYGVRTGHVAVDMRAVRDRNRTLVDRFNRQSEDRQLEAQDGLELVRGEARFTGPRAVEVATDGGAARRLSAAVIVIDTGQRPAVPPIDGIDAVPHLDNRSVMELDAPPAHLVVLGGGATGVEFAQMFRRLGSDVTLVDRSARLLAAEDEDVSETMAGILADEGVKIHTETSASRVRRHDGAIALAVSTPAGAATIEGTHLLLAVGRAPNTDRLDLAAAGVATDDRGYVRTNDRLETNVAGIYAIGDVKGGPAYTHVSYDDYRILAENLLNDGAASTASRLIPYTVYTDPELGRVGMTEAQARAQGIDYRVAKLPMSSVARALETGEARGFMKALVDARSQEILGCAIFGVHGGEIMSAVEIAMMGTLPYTALRDGVFAHPTLAEALNSLFATLG
ncbi:MAG: mercuric reductase [Burkholderiales bacterium]|nr:mercuric reductase [Burkholderiales bacterium]